jgi:hypothetical protein
MNRRMVALHPTKQRREASGRASRWRNIFASLSDSRYPVNYLVVSVSEIRFDWFQSVKSSITTLQSSTVANG